MILQELGKPTDEIVILILLREIVKSISVNSKVIMPMLAENKKI